MSADILHFGGMDSAPNRIREHRLAAKLSQQALADRVGVSKMTISDLERGKMRLATHYMRRLAQALDIQPADLLPAADNPDGLTADERRLIDLLRAATPAQREQLAKVADVILPYGAEPDFGIPAKGRHAA